MVNNLIILRTHRSTSSARSQQIGQLHPMLESKLPRTLTVPMVMSLFTLGPGMASLPPVTAYTGVPTMTTATNHPSAIRCSLMIIADRMRNLLVVGPWTPCLLSGKVSSWTREFAASLEEYRSSTLRDLAFLMDNVQREPNPV